MYDVCCMSVITAYISLRKIGKEKEGTSEKDRHNKKVQNYLYNFSLLEWLEEGYVFKCLGYWIYNSVLSAAVRKSIS